MKSFLVGLFLTIFLSGCAIGFLKKPELKTYKDMRDYKYALLAPTQTLSNTYGWGGGGGLLNTGAGSYADADAGNYSRWSDSWARSSSYLNGLLFGLSSSGSKSVNPADVIAGMLIKKGYIILDPQDAKREGTFIVKYGAGEQGIRSRILGVSIQMIDAQSQELLFTCFAQGKGYTDVSAFRRAITRCLKDFKTSPIKPIREN